MVALAFMLKNLLSPVPVSTLTLNVMNLKLYGSRLKNQTTKAIYSVVRIDIQIRMLLSLLLIYSCSCQN